MSNELNPKCYDVAVVGAGMAGLATACRLAAAGVSTVLLEQHRSVGGCAGYFRRQGFAFDVGATTLVDFGPDGVGGRWLREIGIDGRAGEPLHGYVAWLPDRSITLHRDAAKWVLERRRLGDSVGHGRFWGLLDRLAEVFWGTARQGVSLPFRGIGDVLRAIRHVGVLNLPLARYLRWTMGDALRAYDLRDDAPLVGLLSMLIEDTVHSTIDQSPLINAALGVTIRGAGLTRPVGGMYGFLARVARRYRELGGVLRLSHRVHSIEGSRGSFTLQTSRDSVTAQQVVCALPVQLTARIGPREVREALEKSVERDQRSVGGAIAVFLGVPENEVESQHFTHHQLLQSYETPLGNGNNMFISVSEAGDLQSAPAGFRSVMISTHCAIEEWQGLDESGYRMRKTETLRQLLEYASRVYPKLGSAPRVCEIGTPRTYERFTLRPGGAVGGFRQCLNNSNQRAIPQDIGVPGFYLAGDTTWPGLGTVACVLGSRIVARAILSRKSVREPAALRLAEMLPLPGLELRP